MRSDRVLSFKLRRTVSLPSFIKTATNRHIRRDYALNYRSKGITTGEAAEAEAAATVHVKSMSNDDVEVIILLILSK